MLGKDIGDPKPINLDGGFEMPPRRGEFADRKLRSRFDLIGEANDHSSPCLHNAA
jgi:hypothetical protein